MRRALSSILLVAALGVSLGGTTPEEPSETLQPVVESYYKLAPGKTEEWFALYSKEHLPILRARQQAGDIQRIIIYRPFLHQGGPPWDYKVILVYRDFAALGNRAQFDALERRRYSDWERHRRAERRRWEITEKHWDNIMVEVGAD
ncbi:MAG: hypothetical protein ACE5MH_08595 [Terriglobia bacterium]